MNNNNKKRSRSTSFDSHLCKKIKQSSESTSIATATVLTDQNLLYEILKHVDAKTLGSAACVSKQWNRTVQDEPLWELICTRHWESIGCGSNTLRLVVLALGGFRCPHYLLPLSKPSVSVSTSSSSSTVAAATSTSSWPCLPPPRTIVPTKPTATTAAVKTRWGKDEIQLSLSLLSIRYFEKLNFNNRQHK